MLRRYLPIALFVLVAAALSAAPWASRAAEPELPPGVSSKVFKRAQFIIVGRVSGNARKTQPRLEQMADWLASQLKPHGIEAGAGLVARDLNEMVRFLAEGRVDVVSESVLAALHFEHKAGAEIALREWKRGRPSYQSAFITARDSGIYELSDLKGRRIAFEDKGSTTGFLLPMAVLRAAGLEMVRLATPEQSVPQGKVGYFFVGSEINIAAWSARKLVDAGAYSNRDWERRKRTPERYRKQLRVFDLTDPLPRSVMVMRGGLAPGLRKALVGALLDLGGDPGAGRVRKDYYDVERYDNFEGEAARSLGRARGMYRAVGDLLE